VSAYGSMFETPSGRTRTETNSGDRVESDGMLLADIIGAEHLEVSANMERKRGQSSPVFEVEMERAPTD